MKKTLLQPHPASPARIFPAERPLSAPAPEGMALPTQCTSPHLSSTSSSIASSSISLGSIISERDAKVALEQACSDEQERYRALLSEDLYPMRDVRLETPVAYFMKNHAPRVIIRRAILEVFAAAKGTNVDVRSQTLRRIAQRRLDSQPRSQQEKEIYCLWQEDYSFFCRANNYFIQGIKLYFQQEQYGYQEALPYFVHACKLNDKFVGEKVEKAMDCVMLAHFRRQCLLQLNAQCTNQFESPDDMEALQGLEIMNDLVVPCIGILTNTSIEEDSAAAEEIRGGWCSYLGRDVSGKLQEKFQDFLSKLLDMSAEPMSIKAPPLIHTHKTDNLSQTFTMAIGMIHNSDQLPNT